MEFDDLLPGKAGKGAHILHIRGVFPFVANGDQQYPLLGAAVLFVGVQQTADVLFQLLPGDHQRVKVHRHAAKGGNAFADAPDTLAFQLRGKKAELPVGLLADLLGKRHRHRAVAAGKKSDLFHRLNARQNSEVLPLSRTRSCRFPSDPGRSSPFPASAEQWAD